MTINKNKNEGADDGDHHDQENVRNKRIYGTISLIRILLNSN